MKSQNMPNNVDLLFCLRGADMQSVADQALSAVALNHNANNSRPFTKFKITDVFAVQNTGATSVACTGGIYTAAAKAGTAVVGAGQSWLGLTGADTCVKPTSGYDANILTLPLGASALFLSLTTGSTAACTADIYVFGFPLY